MQAKSRESVQKVEKVCKKAEQVWDSVLKVKC